jgi:hypothetical protein
MIEKIVMGKLCDEKFVFDTGIQLKKIFLVLKGKVLRRFDFFVKDYTQSSQLKDKRFLKFRRLTKAAEQFKIYKF